jgi:tetratricopeptide (TPR) repeat protein
MDGGAMLRVFACAILIISASLLPTVKLLARAQAQHQIDGCEGKSETTPDQIIESCTAAIKSTGRSNPNLAIAYTHRGNAYLKNKDMNRAIADYTEALRLNPKYGVAAFDLCAMTYNSGDTNAATAACKRAIAIDPRKADAYFILGSLEFGLSHLENGKPVAPPDTEANLDKYLTLAPSGGHAAEVKEMLKYLKTGKTD